MTDSCKNYIMPQYGVREPKVTQEELDKLVSAHMAWLDGDPHGKRLLMRDMDLSGTHLVNVDLSHAKFYNVNFSGTTLTYVHFEHTDLKDTNFKGAIIKNCMFKHCNCVYVEFSKAKIEDVIFDVADLRYSYFDGAYLDMVSFRASIMCGVGFYEMCQFPNTFFHLVSFEGCNLINADFRGCNLQDVFFSDHCNFAGAKLNSTTLPHRAKASLQLCPPKGSFTAYKKCREDTLVELRIPADAKRSNGTSRKCRCDKAYVVKITDLITGKERSYARSLYDEHFIYNVGDTVVADGFEEDRWRTCGEGIHFFMTEEEARAYA